MIGCLLSVLTFPGVIVHELGHVIFCRLFGVPVAEVCLFRFGNPAGYVLHAEPENAVQHLFIAFGPFFANTVLGALAAAPVTIPLRDFHSLQPWQYGLLWLGISIAMHAFPSTGDAASLWQGIWRGRGCCLARLIAVPFVGVIYLGALAKMVWLDVIYGIGVAVVLPKFMAMWLGKL